MNEPNFVNCSKNPIGYFLNGSRYYPCYNTCETCLNQGNESNNNCLTCKNNYVFKFDFDFINKNNCYENCSYYYYLNSDGKYICTEDKKCPENYIKLIVEKNRCVANCSQNNNYPYEYNNSCYKSCPENTNVFSKNEYLCKLENSKKINISDIISGLSNINNSNSEEVKADILLNIKNQLKNNELDTLLDQMTKDKKDIIIKYDNIIYQITNTNNVNNQIDEKISNINLGECEVELKDYYNITNEGLLILKIEYNITGSLIPIIDYEIYHPTTKKLLNLSVCDNNMVNLSIPVSIDENDLIKHDPKSDYYADKCYPYTTDSGTDILLKDRYLEFNSNNMSLCENNCNMIDYDKNNQNVICQCELKTGEIAILEINYNENLYYDFSNKNISSSTNSIS